MFIIHSMKTNDQGFGPSIIFYFSYFTVISEVYSTSNLRVIDLNIYIENLLCGKPHAGSCHKTIL